MANSYAFRIIPLNENQELNYQENFIGDVVALKHKCNIMISGLYSILQHGTFSMKIENADGSKYIYYDTDQGFMDQDFNPIPNNSKAHNMFIKVLIS